MQVVTLFRTVSSDEWERVQASGARCWPLGQPLHAVLNQLHATMIARDGDAGVGYVTRFDVDKAYLDGFEARQVAGLGLVEYWIPAERLGEFNEHIVGVIEQVSRVESDA